MSTTATATTAYSFVYRGNSIDAWISTFIAYTAVKDTGVIQFYPISAGREVTEKQVASWSGTHVLLLDLSLSPASHQKMVEGGVLSVEFIDYRFNAAAEAEAEAEEKACTSLLAWRKWYNGQQEPFWLSAVDRMSRWDKPTMEDRCLREILSNVAHMPPTDAIKATEVLMTWMTMPLCPEFQSLMAQGHATLQKKDGHLMMVLSQLGRVYDIQEADIQAWGLTSEWLGLRVFLLENSEVIIDTNEAAYIVFGHFPDVAAFINYRKKVRRNPKTGSLGLVYLYSARSHGFDLTTGGFFQGQTCSAGAQCPIGLEKAVPFLPLPPLPSLRM